MKKLFILFAIISISACNSDESENDLTDIPDCILDIIDDFENDLITVRVQETNNEFHYWLNTGHISGDGKESIVNSDCNEVCFFQGFWPSPDCVLEYSEDWTVIWQR